MERPSVCVAAAVLALALSGCGGSSDKATTSSTPTPSGPTPSVSLAPGSVSKQTLEAKVSESLIAKSGTQFITDCPSALNAKIGTQVTCVATAANGSSFNATVTVDSVANGTIHFALDATPRPT